MNDAEKYMTHVRDVVGVCVGCMTWAMSNQIDHDYIRGEYESAVEAFQWVRAGDDYFELEDGGQTWSVGFDIVDGKTTHALGLVNLLELQTFVDAALEMVRTMDNEYDLWASFYGLVGDSDYTELHAAVLPYPLHTWYLRMRVQKKETAL